MSRQAGGPVALEPGPSSRKLATGLNKIHYNRVPETPNRMTKHIRKPQPLLD